MYLSPTAMRQLRRVCRTVLVKDFIAAHLLPICLWSYETHPWLIENLALTGVSLDSGGRGVWFPGGEAVLGFPPPIIPSVGQGQWETGWARMPLGLN